MRIISHEVQIYRDRIKKLEAELSEAARLIENVKRWFPGRWAEAEEFLANNQDRTKELEEENARLKQEVRKWKRTGCRHPWHIRGIPGWDDHKVCPTCKLDSRS